jgi:NADPH:quinone reductase-like Zn-dependent oxidoreductase
MREHSMKAMVYERFGSPDNFELKEVLEPAIGDADVLIRVRAASVNSWDWDLVRGATFFSRLDGGLRAPKRTILGADVAGTVEAIGNHVTDINVGDDVFGDISGAGFGGFAEYVSVPAELLAPKSPHLTFEQAAAVPQSGLLAIQSLRYCGPIQPDQHVLVNGAGGGAGTFTVQIAKTLGAEVTGVDSTPKMDVMQKAGADHVIDFTREDYTRTGDRYEAIVDHAAHRSVLDSRRALAPGGTYAMLGGASGRLLQMVVVGLPVSWFGKKRLGIVPLKPNRADLLTMNDYIETGEVTPLIDRTFPLHELPDALGYFGEGQVKGKIVISI